MPTNPVESATKIDAPLVNDPLVNILLDCLRYDGCPPDSTRLARLSAEEWQKLINLALQQSIGPLFDHRLTGHGLGAMIPPAGKQSLREQYRHNTLRNLKLQSELRHAVTALQEAGIPAIALKGIYLALAVYKNLGLRQMSDIDLLIRPQDINRARQVLQQIGYNELAEEVPSTSFHHTPPLKKSGAQAIIELHWTIIPQTSPFRINPADLWARAIPLNGVDFELLGLSHEDLLLHLFLHNGYIHRFVQGLRNLIDVAEIIKLFNHQLDWAVLEERARQWQCVHATSLSLFLTARLLNVPLPENITHDIAALKFDPRLLHYILNQLTGKPAEKVSISRNFGRLWADISWPAKIGVLLRSIFRPPQLIAQMYGLPENSLRVYFYYLVRAKDLWQRYRGSAQQMLAGESQFVAKIETDNTFSDWLTTA